MTGISTATDASAPDHRPPKPLRLSVAQSLTRLALAAERFTRLLTEADLTAEVRCCPGWRLSDLAAHLGRIHCWADHIVLTGDPDAEPPAAPADQAQLAGWYRSCADDLLATLRQADPDAPAWMFGSAPGTTAFWIRRQSH